MSSEEAKTDDNKKHEKTHFQNYLQATKDIKVYINNMSSSLSETHWFIEKEPPAR